MRDLVSYHRARLPYDSDDVLENPANPVRMKMLQEIAEEESRQALRRAYQNYAKQTPERNRSPFGGRAREIPSAG